MVLGDSGVDWEDQEVVVSLPSITIVEDRMLDDLDGRFQGASGVVLLVAVDKLSFPLILRVGPLAGDVLGHHGKRLCLSWRLL